MTELQDFLSVIEAASDLGCDPELLIRSAALGDLTIFVFAKSWSVSGVNKSEKEVLDGPVYLLARDLMHSVGADYTPVREVRKPDSDEVFTLDDPREKLRGALYVTAEEFGRFRRERAFALNLKTDAAPYLDAKHEWHAPELALAVEAWMALFADGKFRLRGKTAKTHVDRWLTARNARLSVDARLSDNARARIATLINPKVAKPGGSPRTFD